MYQQTPQKGELFARTSNPVRGGVLRGILTVLLLGVVLASSLGVFTSVKSRFIGHASAATSATLNFQARLMSSTGSIVPDGDYNVRFKLYDASTSGTLLWTETRDYNGGSPDYRVHVANGYLTVNLGSVNSFPGTINWDQDLYLTMDIGGSTTTASYDGEMNPRLKLTAVPYAFKAGQAAQLQVIQSSYTGTLSFGTLTGSSAITIPDSPGNATDTVCLKLLNNCAAPGGSFIQNGNSVQTAANFYIRSANIGYVGGVIEGANGQTADLLDLNTYNGTTSTIVARFTSDGNLQLANTLDTATGVALNIGASGSPTTTAINLNQNTTIATGKSLTVTAGLTSLTGPSAGSSNVLSIASGAATTNTELFIQGAASQSVPTAIIKLGSGQTGNLLTLQDSTGVTVSSFNSSGDLRINGEVTTRNVATASTNSNDLKLASGNATGSSSNSGNVNIDAGTATATTGNVNVGTTNASSVNIGRTGTNTKINGTLQIASVIDVQAAGALNIGATSSPNATVINLNQNTTLASGMNLTVTAGNTLLNGSGTQSGTGTLSTAGGFTVTGTGTTFTTQLKAGDVITASGQTQTIAKITNNTSLTTQNIFSPSLSGATFTFANPVLSVTDATDQSGIVIKANTAAQAGNALQVVDNNGQTVARIVSTSGSYYTSNNIVAGTLSTIPVAAQAYFVSAVNTNSALVLRGATSQGVDLFRLQDSSGNINASFDSTGSILQLGRIAASGTVTQGKLVLSDGSTDNLSLTLQSATLSGSSKTLTFDNVTGTALVLQNTGSPVSQTGNIDITAANNGAPTATFRAIAGQTDILKVISSGSGTLVFFNNSGQGGVKNNFVVGSTSASSTINLLAISTANTNIAAAIRAFSGSQSGDLLQLQDSGGVPLSGFASTGDLYFGQAANHTITVNATTSNAAGKNLTISAGAAGSGASAFVGGNLVLQGGNAAGTGNANGGDVTILGGNGVGTGVQGLVNIGPATFRSVANTACGSNCTITQANVDNYGDVVISASTSAISIQLPDPTRTADVGRVIYITADAASLDFTLTTNAGATAISVAMRANTTATMIWNGTDWTPGGASNATTLQATYNNGSNPSTTPEIKLDSTRGTIDIQDADTTIGADILDIRGSNAGNLGTVLFGVSNNGRVTIQNTADQSSSFRVLNSAGDYVLNVNSSNSYVLSNSVKDAANAIVNASFESGGSAQQGEEGWFGPGQASIVNSSANANSGNYELQVSPNNTDLKTYAGTYYEVSPGDVISFQGWVKNSAGANGTGGFIIESYDKDKAFVTSASNVSLPGTSYTLKTVSYTVPSSGVKYVRVAAIVKTGATTGTWYFDDLSMNTSIRTATVFQNTVDSTSAFQIQSSSDTLFTADTTNNILKVGNATGTNTSTTILVVDSATADPSTLTGKNGGLFYRSDTNTLKAIVGGAVVDVCTTAVTCTGYAASATSSIQLQTGSVPGVQQTGFFNITGTGYMTGVKTQNLASGNTDALSILTGNATSGNSGSITLDTGTASGTLGSINIGHSGVTTTVKGTLEVGVASSVLGSVKLYNTNGANNVTIRANALNPTSSWNLTLPQNPGNSGDCLKASSGSGDLSFSSCTSGVTTTLQDAYNNSSAPAAITLASSKDLDINTQSGGSSTSSVVINLQCTSTCGASAGRFAIQNNSGADIFTVSPSGSTNGLSIVLAAYTQIGSATTDGTQVNFQLDSYNGSSDSGSCTTTTNQGAMYYNSNFGTIRACVNGAWSDITNPEALGLLSFGVVPQSGANAYDLPSLSTPGVSGPCKVSRASNNSVSIEPCVAYSGGRRVAVTTTVTLTTNSASSPNINLTTTAQWGHICIDSSGTVKFTTTAGQTSASNGLPTFSVAAPILCLADVKGSASTAGLIDDIYDLRTFTSAIKEAVTVSTVSEMGMLVDAGTGGAMIPAQAGSAKLYGVIVSYGGGTSTTNPNAIVTTVGPAWVKANAGTAGQFIKTSATDGYGNTTASIPNNSFYFSVGNTRTSFDTTCTAANNCSSSLYVNFIVR